VLENGLAYFAGPSATGKAFYMSDATGEKVRLLSMWLNTVDEGGKLGQSYKTFSPTTLTTAQ
jgi:hypothetical protein